MELKKTLLMPRTGFEMRGNLNVKEPLVVAKWQSEDLYGKMLLNRQGCEEFQLHDGPPYANGDMHAGHMLNRFLKDFVVRYKNMQGYATPFVFGWDTHGLPIENKITKAGIDRKALPVPLFRDKCDSYAKEQVERQKTQIMRLGVMGDFAHPYLTLQPEFEAWQIEVFAKMALKGLIFKGLKPVYWSPSSESALAEAEIEYTDVKSHAVFVAFDVIDGKKLLSKGDKIIIWTTTPWTLPANLAISLHPDFEYGLFHTEKGNFVFLKKFQESLKAELGFQECTLIKSFKGRKAEFITTKHPFYDRESIVILGEHVTDDAGTGAVHTAPGHGEDDFIVGKKYNLPAFCPVDGKGVMTAEAGPELTGLFYEAANEKVLSMLRASGALIKESIIVHSYPHDWRTGKPLIYRATPQWFCSIEPIREKLLAEIDRVKWTPEWGKKRIYNMIHDRGDWCISRQRVWGVPIPIFYAEDDTPIIDEKIFDHIKELFREHGSNYWFLKEANDLLPKGYTNAHSPHGIFRKETDIMDVWFDSGSSSNGVLKNRHMKFPADLYLEGSDQYRGWFNSSLIISVAVDGVAPYQNVVSHGFVTDGSGEKMSKSKGNGLDPIKMTNVFGADVLRLWAATINYQDDVRISEDMLKGTAETYRKIRNTFKFLLGTLSDGETTSFDPSKDQVKTFEPVDLYILATLEKVKNSVIEDLDHYDFAGAMMAITNFVSVDLSAFYCDITKDILYCERFDSLRRRQAQTVIFQVIDQLLRLLTPILPFTMDEIYSYLPGHAAVSSQLLDFPKATHLYEESLHSEYAAVIKVRSDVLKALEIARTSGLIGSAQEASVQLHVKGLLAKKVLSKLAPAELARYFIVSHVTLTDKKVGEEYESSSVKITHHDGEKCERCWNYVPKLNEVEGTHICPRCQEAVGK